MKDRRIDRRLPVETKVIVHRRNGEDITALSHNWSRSGVFLRTEPVLEIGERVQLSLPVPSQGGYLSFSAVVIRQVPKISSDAKHPAGVAFYVGSLPPAVSQIIGDMARGIVSPLESEGVQFEGGVMLIGGGKSERAKHSIFLEQAGAEVADAETLDQAEILVQKGFRPRAIVLFTPFIKDVILGFIDRIRKATGPGHVQFVVVSDLSQGTPEALHHHALMVVSGPVEPRRLLPLLVVLLGHVKSS